VGFISTSSKGPEATAEVTLNVELSSPSWKTVKVDYLLSDGTAKAGEDYLPDGGTLTFAPNEILKKVPITVLDDSIYEGDETITVTLSNATEAILGNNYIHTYTIENDDDPPILEFIDDSSQGDEDNITANILVKISGKSSLTAKVDFSIVPGGTATGGEDYTIIDGYLEFASGQTDPEAIKIPILEDLLDEDNETFTVTLSNPTDASIGTKDSHTYTILDDDPPPTVSFDSAGSDGEEAAVTQVTLVVDLSEESGRDVTVGYTVTGTATRGDDYILDDGTLTFLEGATKPTEDIVLTILNDDFGEPKETVIVTLSAASETVEPGKHMVYTYEIINDDLPSVAFAADISGAPEADSPAVIPVVLSPFLGDKVTVEYNVDPAGTAQAPEDYIPFTPGTLTFPEGLPADQVTQNIEIQIVDDAKVEEHDTIIIKLSNPSGATIGANASHTYTIVNDDDETEPNTYGYIPEPNAVQVARDTIIQLHITDEMIGTTSGVDFESVEIKIEGDVIYDGDNETDPNEYDSTLMMQKVKGICRRVGTEGDYKFVFHPSALFDYEQQVDVAVYAEDKAGNPITEDYYFYTVMRSFAKNIKVNTDTDTGTIQNNPATAIDSAENIWVVWDEAASDSDIYIGKLPEEDGGAFKTSVPVIKAPNNQRNPAIAIDASDVLYVVYEEIEDIADPNRDIMLLTSADGETWTGEPFQVNEDNPDKDKGAPNMAQNPAIAISGDEMYVTWEEKRVGNKDIWARYRGGAPEFKWEDAKPVTTDASAQSGPSIAIDESDNTAYIAWTDARNAGTTGRLDIYGAESLSPTLWSEAKLVATDSNQWSPSGAVCDDGDMHLLWVDDEDGYINIFYGNDHDTDWPITGASIVDEPDYVQSAPAIAVDGTKLFACWQDYRNVANNNADTDIYFAESGSDFGTNILVNDDVGANTQTAPDIGINDGDPYIVWVDDRNGNNDIYYAGPITISDPLDIDVSSGVGFTLVEATTSDNLKVTVKIPDQPLGVDPSEITIREIDVNDLPALPPGSFGVPYDLGPSGLVFSPPVTVTIQHAKEDCPGHAIYNVYWYNTETGTWSQEGISDVQHLTDAQDPSLPPDVHAVRFTTTHFTGFGTGGGAAPAAGGGGGGGGGGCDISPNNQGNVIEYMLPYVFLTIVWIIIKRKDARNRKTIV